MKKRLRKKRHMGDFAEYGTLVKISVPHNNIEKMLNKFQYIVEKHRLSAWGGCNSIILTPKVSGNYVIPSMIEQFIISMMNVEDDGNLAFIVNSPNHNQDQAEFVDDIKQEFGEARYQLKVIQHLNLWKLPEIK